MSKKILLIFGLITFLSLSAKEPITFKLWDNVAPPSDNGLTPENEVMENPGWISLVATPELTIYPAENPNGTTLLMCPGGGYSGVAIGHEGNALAAPLNDVGITVAVLKYRMPNGHYQVPAEDVSRAFEILMENSSEFGINPERIGIGGASAGGHLASTVATHKTSDSFIPAFQFLLYPVISMEEGVTHQGSRDNLLGLEPSEELVNYYSNQLQVTPETPPAFIALSGDDMVVPVKNSLDYIQALTDNGIPVSLHLYPTGGHGWGYKPDFKYFNMWVPEFLFWIDNLFKE